MTAKEVFITGVSSGLGRALAELYLEGGAKVYGVSRRRPDLDKSEGFIFQSADLSQADQTRTALKELFGERRDLDLVILNAGIIGKIADMADVTAPDCQRVLDVNVWANKVVLDYFFANGFRVSQVIAVSSGAAVSANRGFNAYSISKAALNMMIGLYAAERPDTHFFSLGPGIVDTAMQEYMANLPEDQKFPTVSMLRRARGTPSMPSPKEGAERFVKGIEKAREKESGGFADVSELI